MIASKLASKLTNYFFMTKPNIPNPQRKDERKTLNAVKTVFNYNAKAVNDAYNRGRLVNTVPKSRTSANHSGNNTKDCLGNTAGNNTKNKGPGR